jgi:chaperone modulatory protein CbpM
MIRETVEASWLEVHGELTLSELAERAAMPEAFVRELVFYGALEPVDPQASSWTFGAHCVVAARRASRLANDLDLDAHGLSIALGLLERIEALEGELSRLRARKGR